MSGVPGWPVAFRGTAAVAAGLVTRDRLRGPRFLRLFLDTYVAAPDTPPPDLTLRSHAAYRYVEGRGVLSGYSAAEVLGASCGPRNAPPEVTVPHRGQRTPGLLVRRERLAPGEIRTVDGLEVTTVRTAYDLARRGDLVERVVAVDALANRHGFAPDLLLHFAGHYEYEGEGHADVGAVLRDVGRYTALVDKGWRIYRYTKFDILHRPDRILAQLARALDRARTT